jgi:hypothetical protein
VQRFASYINRATETKDLLPGNLHANTLRGARKGGYAPSYVPHHIFMIPSTMNAGSWDPPSRP